MGEPQAAVAIVHACGAAESVLLIRRTERPDDAWSGHWSFPGGRRDAPDSDLLHTALRELEEECGIRLCRDQMERALPHALAGRRAGQFVLVAPFLFRVPAESATVLNPHEAVEGRWVPLALLRDPARHALLAVPGQPDFVRFPAVDLNGVPVWGFTYRLISDWLGLGPLCRPISQAGFAAAEMALSFLLSHGLRLAHGWVDGPASREAAGVPLTARVAAVDGPIPASLVLAHFSVPGRHVEAVSRLEVHPGLIRIHGPALEEYRIEAP